MAATRDRIQTNPAQHQHPSSKADETTKRRGQVGTERSRTVVPGVRRVEPPADALDVVVLLVQPQVVRELSRVRRVSGGHTKDSSVMSAQIPCALIRRQPCPVPPRRLERGHGRAPRSRPRQPAKDQGARDDPISRTAIDEMAKVRRWCRARVHGYDEVELRRLGHEDLQAPEVPDPRARTPAPTAAAAAAAMVSTGLGRARAQQQHWPQMKLDGDRS